MNAIVIDGEPVPVEVFTGFRRRFPNWYRESRFGQLWDGYRNSLPDAPPVAPAVAPAPQTQRKDNDAMNENGPFLRDYETHKSEWTWGKLPCGSVMYIRSLYTGRDAAVLALASKGCTRIGASLPFISEADLVRKFAKMGWSCAGRYLDAESIDECERMGFLKIGRRA